MDKWLKNVGMAYEDFTQKCDAAAKKCSEFAASCSDKQAEATAKRKKAAVGGFLATVGGVALTGVGFVTAGPLGLMIAGGAALTGGLIAHETFEAYAKKEKYFRSLSLCFRDLAKQGIDLKRQFDSIHNTIMRYEKHNTFLQNTADEHIDTICSALDQLQEILGLNHSETLKAKEIMEASYHKKMHQ